MKYGHFSKDGLEYIITDPAPPRPWINYLTNEKYCAIISQCGGGYSFYRDCRSNRITRWLPENWHFDRPGRYIYVRESNQKPVASNQKTNIWSATYQPLRVKPDFYQSRHGLGYTVIETTYYDINIHITYFVPAHDDCELWLIKVSNCSKDYRDLQFFPYIEWLLGDYHLELRYRNIMNLYNRVWFEPSHKAIFAKKTAIWSKLNIQPFGDIAFFASSLPVKGYATRKGVFLGKYNTEEYPQMVVTEGFRSTPVSSGEDGIGCFFHRLRLAPKGTREFVVILGQTEGVSTINKILAKYRNIHSVKEELEDVKSLWRRRILNNIKIETPDKDFDTMINIWVKYQLYICNFWSRSPSYYHEGTGGRGYRDSCQDAEAIVSINPEHACKKIRSLASLIRRDGTTAPGWSDTFGPAWHRPNKDHPLWLVYTISAYIKETGDKGILLEHASYLKDGWVKGWEIDPNWKGGPVADGEGTIFEHLEKNLAFTFNDVGSKGLPLIGHADWNDAIDVAGIKMRGQSVWLAMALVRSLKQLSELAGLIGEEKKSKDLLSKAKTMTERINRYCWDGNWYKRGFTDSGTVYGSKENREGKIYVNTQAWAVLSGVAGADKLPKLMKSVDRYLDGEHGIALFYPAYSKFNPELGRISMFSEGTKENAAVFCHAAAFMIAADCMARRGNKAYEQIKKIMPNSQKDYDLYKTEPYVLAEYLVGPEHPYLYGEGAFSWITGTAGWTFLVATEWMLGVRRDWEGLLLDPCIPSHWKSCKITRPFRGATYQISIENPKGVEHGLKEIFVDGEKIKGNLIRPHRDGKIHQVKVVMG